MLEVELRKSLVKGVKSELVDKGEGTGDAQVACLARNLQSSRVLPGRTPCQGLNALIRCPDSTQQGQG